MTLELITRRAVRIDHVATGEQVRAARKAAGISLREMARRIEFSAPYLSDLENGRRNWNSEMLARYEQQIRNE
jgi:transcriptional regulator with XRE-family HTH domain